MMKRIVLGIAGLLVAALAGCGGAQDGGNEMAESKPKRDAGGAGEEIATLGAGCYWCIEAVLQQVPGVLGLRSGFMGGHVENPTYEQVCGGETGHAEVVEVRFDPAVLSYSKLLDWFWKLHDPTQKDRQGNDVGTQYRSAIFTHSDAQAAEAKASLARLSAAKTFAAPVVTEITPASMFYPAPDYHQDYYRQNRGQAYCRIVIAPKLEKLDLDR